MGTGEEVAVCLVFRGSDKHGRRVVCLQDATVEIWGATTRRRRVCARCACELFDAHLSEDIKMRALPRMMEKLLR